MGGRAGSLLTGAAYKTTHLLSSLLWWRGGNGAYARSTPPYIYISVGLTLKPYVGLTRGADP